MSTYFNYTQLVTRDKKEYLFDPSTAARRIADLERLQQKHAEVFRLLKKSDYPAAEPYCRAVALDGAAGLRKCVLNDLAGLLPNDAPEFYRRQQSAFALEAIPADMLEEADRLAAELVRNNNGIPIKPEDETFDPERGIVLNIEAISQRIEAGCSWPIDEATRELAKEVRDAILEIRRLRGRRVDVKKIILSRLGDPLAGYPDLPDSDLEVLKACSVGLLPPDTVIRAQMEQAAHSRENTPADGIPVNYAR